MKTEMDKNTVSLQALPGMTTNLVDRQLDKTASGALWNGMYQSVYSRISGNFAIGVV
jgi:hypothetical protein